MTSEGGDRFPSRMGTRNRDPLGAMPLLPCTAGKTLEGPSVRNGPLLDFFDLPEVVRANFTILAVSRLAMGSLMKVRGSELPMGSPSTWARAAPLSREASSRVLGCHRSCEPPTDRPRGPKALFRFRGRVPTMAATANSSLPKPPTKTSTTSSVALLQRGDLCPAVVEQIAMPPASTCPVEMAKISPRCANVLNHFETKMLNPEGQALMAESDVTPYTDPALTSRRAKVQLAARMWVSGMLRGAKAIKGRIHPFTVVKKVERNPPISLKDVIMRMVLDQRVDNLAWKEAPWTPMANPSMFPFVDCSKTTIGNRQVEMVTGDLPDWYWTLQIPQGMEEYFVLDGASPKDVSNALREFYSIDHTFPPEIVGLGLRVPAMGWRWAVVLAQWTLEDLLDSGVSALRASTRLSYKIVLPQLTKEVDTVHWEFIDDVGAMILGEAGDKNFTSAKGLGSEIKSHLADQGFGYHKETYDLLATTLGHEISPQGFGVRILRAKFWAGVGATEHLLKIREVPARTLESLVSFWCWASMVARSALSIWRTTYYFVQKHRDDPEPMEVPAEVIEEFQMALFISPMLASRMDLEWSTEVFMMDSSVDGAGLIATQATMAEIKAEAKFAETKGWSVTLEEVASQIDEWTTGTTEVLDSDPPMMNPLTSQVSMKVVRMIHLFSGPRREGDLEHYMRLFAATAGVIIAVESIDILIHAGMDLRETSFFESLLAAVRAGIFYLMHAGLICRTWSKARFKRPGPPILRTREEPYGVSGLSLAMQAKVDSDTILFRRTFQLAREMEIVGGYYSIENPEDPGVPPYPSIFATHEAEVLRLEHAAVDIRFDQWMFGLGFVKSTQIITNVQALMTLDAIRMPRGTPRPKAMTGVTPDGQYVTHAQAAYPARLCEALAQAFISIVPDLSQSFTEFKPKEETAETAWVLGRVPMLGKAWDPLERWHELFRTTWKHKEHNNIGELRIAVLCLRHLARKRSTWDTRSLCITDSLVTLGVLTKGRSASWPLLRLARQAAAIQLVLGIRPYWRYIETGRNHADGPSRGFPIGHAPAWVEELDKAELQRHIRSLCRKKLV